MEMFYGGFVKWRFQRLEILALAIFESLHLFAGILLWNTLLMVGVAVVVGGYIFLK